MNNSFLEYVKEGNYTKAIKFVNNLNDEELYDFIFYLGFDEDIPALYTFISIMLLTKETAPLHFLAGALMIAPLVHNIENSYSMGIFHARRCVALDPYNSTYLEFLLSFYGIPDRLLAQKEAKETANNLELYDPGHSSVKNFFKKVKAGY